MFVQLNAYSFNRMFGSISVPYQVCVLLSEILLDASIFVQNYRA